MQRIRAQWGHQNHQYKIPYNNKARLTSPFIQTSTSPGSKWLWAGPPGTCNSTREKLKCWYTELYCVRTLERSALTTESTTSIPVSLAGEELRTNYSSKISKDYCIIILIIELAPKYFGAYLLCGTQEAKPASFIISFVEKSNLYQKHINHQPSPLMKLWFPHLTYPVFSLIWNGMLLNTRNWCLFSGLKRLVQRRYIQDREKFIISLRPSVS